MEELEEIKGEVEAISIGLSIATRMMGQTGFVRPTVVGLKMGSAGWIGMWEMDVTSALMRGIEGLDELAYVMSKVVSKEGCDLSAIGVKPEHFKADAVVMVAEGQAGSLKKGNGGESEREEWRCITLEMKVEGQCSNHLYRVVGFGEDGISVELVGKAMEGQLAKVEAGKQLLH